MERTPHGWTVLDEAAGVLTYRYVFAPDGSTANAFTLRLADGQLALLSPPAAVNAGPDAPVDAGVCDDLERFGGVGALVANNGLHHLGQAAWKARCPAARAFAPAAAMSRIRKKNPEAGSFEPLEALQALIAEDVSIHEVVPSKCGELWAWAKTADGYLWFASDLLANFPELPDHPIMKHVFKWTRNAPGLRLFTLAMLLTVKKKQSLLRRLRDDLRAHPPQLIVPGHGDLLQGDDLPQRVEALLSAAIK